MNASFEALRAGIVPWPDAVVELRQYTLRPGARDTLVALFEREFVESQEALGMHVIGQFHDLDRPDRFVWLRGFASMAERAHALQAFYGGPVWQRHRDAANGTMLDSDDVLLLRPARAGAGFAQAALPRPRPGEPTAADAVLVAGICRLAQPAEAGFMAAFEAHLRPLLLRHGAAVRACLVTEPAPNTFPRLPVREGEQVFAWFAGFESTDAHLAHLAALARDPDWRLAIERAHAHGLREPPAWLRLRPTPRSELRA
ncbi:NIPSNAP family protein [Marilutibacter aestuarii]|uniref:NIPSNAP family protein n=1 Tax=Marilutibacter aestuarii TaxID=1706195 RepID=A0A507ZR40_9GAMM|nr:NIPSNAP family protein [Lysobacter aestuarii]TQD38734.1 NIPSNAP family protein [Lysobacter aestuarii]